MVNNSVVYDVFETSAVAFLAGWLGSLDGGIGAAQSAIYGAWFAGLISSGVDISNHPLQFFRNGYDRTHVKTVIATAAGITALSCPFV